MCACVWFCFCVWNQKVRERVVNRILEYAGFGAETFAYFDGGRVESWLNGRTLEPEEMMESKIQPHVKSKLIGFF